MSDARTTASSRDAFSPCMYAVSKAALHLSALLWLRLRVEGREHVPQQGPLLAVGNHASYLDPPLLGIGVKRRVHFLAQRGLQRFPPLRWWLRKVGVSIIDRNAPDAELSPFGLLALLAHAYTFGVIPGFDLTSIGLPEPARSRGAA